ncbi:mevalonate kinase [uncultured Vagococcus sp.]|uniref:mevalonate kinase n=1 Tax=uncultured Vagococcus sp. TaxID=189676 RepID=UPI0028D30754|nr:mevalonate kinase [uncultured Vagococcus sp.]
MSTQGIGYANGKIILMGEHSVVYGEPSIAIPFPATQIKTTVQASEGETAIDCVFYKGLLNDMPELLESLKAVIKVSLERLGQTDTLSLTIDSTIPAERGMGSSAAVAVATTRGIYDYFQQPLAHSELLEIVDISEKIAHGNPSGLDALMTSSSTPYYYIKGQPVTPIDLHLTAVLVVADTGKTGQTKEAVANVGEKVRSKSGAIYQRKIKDLGQLAKASKDYLSQNQPEKLGLAMNQAQNLLSELGVSSLELDALVVSALSHNALGAKLTGGGRGGCMIALARDLNDAQVIASALKAAGAKATWLYEMSGN